MESLKKDFDFLTNAELKFSQEFLNENSKLEVSNFINENFKDGKVEFDSETFSLFFQKNNKVFEVFTYFDKDELKLLIFDIKNGNLINSCKKEVFEEINLLKIIKNAKESDEFLLDALVSMN